MEKTTKRSTRLSPMEKIWVFSELGSSTKLKECAISADRKKISRANIPHQAASVGPWLTRIAPFLRLALRTASRDPRKRARLRNLNCRSTRLRGQQSTNSKRTSFSEKWSAIQRQFGSEISEQRTISNVEVFLQERREAKSSVTTSKCQWQTGSLDVYRPREP